MYIGVFTGKSAYSKKKPVFLGETVDSVADCRGRMFSYGYEARIACMSAENDAAVPDLMRRTEQIKSARQEALRETRDVEKGSNAIEKVRGKDFAKQELGRYRVKAPKTDCVQTHEKRTSRQRTVHEHSEDAENISMEVRDDGDHQSYKIQITREREKGKKVSQF